MNTFISSVPLSAVGIGLGLGVLLLTILLWWLVFRRRAALPRNRLRKVSIDLLQDVLISDGDGGQIHLEYAAFCLRGIVLVNIKQLEGTLFASDAMNEWAIISPQRRTAILNPQGGLYDRTAAARRLVSDMPVYGYIAFTGNFEISKDAPSHVIAMDALIAELQGEQQGGTEVSPAWAAIWAEFKQATSQA